LEETTQPPKEAAREVILTMEVATLSTVRAMSTVRTMTRWGWGCGRTEALPLPDGREVWAPGVGVTAGGWEPEPKLKVGLVGVGPLNGVEVGEVGSASSLPQEARAKTIVSTRRRHQRRVFIQHPAGIEI
jgi:hypothetical protein